MPIFVTSVHILRHIFIFEWKQKIKLGNRRIFLNARSFYNYIIYRVFFVKHYIYLNGVTTVHAVFSQKNLQRQCFGFKLQPLPILQFSY